MVRLLQLCGWLLIAGGILSLLFHAGSRRRLRSLLDSSWHIERFFYRHHHLTGTLMVMGAATFISLLSIKHSLRLKPGNFWGSPQGQIIVQWVEIAGWLFACLALLIGLIVIIRPSLIKPLESGANRWIGAQEPHEEPPTEIPGTQTLHPLRGAGLLMILAGALCLGLSLTH